jgi:hypothetical protein
LRGRREGGRQSAIDIAASIAALIRAAGRRRLRRDMIDVAATVGLVLGFLLDLPPPRDIAIVLFKRRGEDMAAGTVSDEIGSVVCIGLATASRAARPGLVIGPGGRPSMM